jgi:hypothetical protein
LPRLTGMSKGATKRETSSLLWHRNNVFRQPHVNELRQS